MIIHFVVLIIAAATIKTLQLSYFLKINKEYVKPMKMKPWLEKILT